MSTTTERQTPETDATIMVNRGLCFPGMETATQATIDLCRRLECEVRELRAALRRCQNEYIKCCHDKAMRRDTEMEAVETRLQTVRDEAFGAAEVSPADANITAIEDGITAMRMENQALRHALELVAPFVEDAYCEASTSAWGTTLRYKQAVEAMREVMR